MKKNLVTRTSIKIEPNTSRVLIRPFVPNNTRIVKIIARIMAQSDEEVQEHLDKINKDFSSRHIEVKSTFLKRYEEVKPFHFTDIEPSHERKLLIGSYFTSEYSLESAALFNPSIIPHPDQSKLESGSTRFIMSLRAVGEGHISSVAFRSGIIDKDNNICIHKPNSFVSTPDLVLDRDFDKKILSNKILDLGFRNRYSDKLMDMLPESFDFIDIQKYMQELNSLDPALSLANSRTKEKIIWLASSNYDIKFDSSIPIGGRAIFPNSPSEKHGIEDVRFVKFRNDNGTTRYFGTATAWDGRTILSQLIETDDFLTFKIRSLNGEAVKNKGMALFPRKIRDKYAMISRQDNENIFIMYSDHLQFWRTFKIIAKPSYPWEYYQIGNCGSPIETDKGWLLITHGVGAMRRYAIGAMLLDKDNPSKVLGRTKEPILMPNENEREGYVPNVVYSCGSMIHNEQLILPYAMSDYATRIATVDLRTLLNKLVKE